MELANVIVAIGGDKSNTVPKYGVTPAEIAVLMTIHGNEAVFDIQPLFREVERSASQERERLFAKYPAKDDDNNPIVAKVYPGNNPIMHMTLEDLQLPEEAFAATERVKPKKTEKPKSTKSSTKKSDPKPPPAAELSAAGAGGSNSADHLFDE